MEKIDNLDKKSEAEGKLILEKCSGIIVSMDGRGKQLSSPELADFIKNSSNSNLQIDMVEISKATYASAMSVAKKIPERSKIRMSFLLNK